MNIQSLLNIIILFSIVLLGCNDAHNTSTKSKKFPACKIGLMQPGIYELSANTSIPKVSASANAFSITIDTSFRAVSYRPYFYEYVKTFRRTDKQELAQMSADFNDGKQMVWLINKSADTISLQTGAFDLIAVLEAKDLNATWKPVEYMRPVFDNFQYGIKKIPPNKASFLK